MFLHFIPARDLANRHHGTYKDVISRVQWLQNRFADYRQIAVQDDDPAGVDAVLADGEMLEGSLVEYSYFPRIVKRLKQLAPDVVVAVRSINLEPLQHFDNHGWWPSRGPFWMLYGMGRLLAHDLSVKRTADVILSINQWENRVYWNRLPGRAKVEWLPYRCPDHLLPAKQVPYAERRIIACLPTSQKNRKSWDLVTRFQRFATTMKQHGSQDAFVVSGRVSSWGLPLCADIRYTGFVEDLPALMGSCKAVALLSPLGFGLKTTMIDGLAAGAHVLAHPDLIRHSPDLIKPYLLSFDGDRTIPVEALAETLESEPCDRSLHVTLLERANGVLNDWFGGCS